MPYSPLMNVPTKVFVLMLGLQFSTNCSPLPSQYVDLGGYWEYIWGRNLGTRSVTDLDLNWETAEFPAEIPGRSGDNYLLVRCILPELSENLRDPALYLHTVMEDFNVYLDRKEIYSFGSLYDKSKHISSFMYPHVISLPRDVAGKELRIYFHSSYHKFIGADHYILIANEGDIKEAMLIFDFPRYLLGCIYILICVFSILIFAFNPRNRLLLLYSILIFLNALIAFAGNYVSNYFFENKNIPVFLYNVSLYFLPLAFFWYMGELYKREYATGIWIGKIILTLLPLILLTLIIANESTFLNNEAIFDLFIIPALGYTLYITIKESKKGDVNSRILFFGMVVLSIFSIFDIMVDLRILNSTVILYWYGIFILMITQGSILLRRLFLLQKNYELKENELFVAQKIQNILLPTIPKSIGDWEMESCYLPMKEVGGDFFDLFIDEKQNFGIIILDVSGHGVGSSIIASMAKISFSHCVGFMNNPAEVMKEMNRSLWGKLGDHFLTGFYLYANSHHSTVSFTSAGHPPGFLVSHLNNEVVEFRTRSKPIGITKNVEYTNSYLYLKEGDIIFLYTDGVVELQNPAGEEIGEQRVKEILLDHSLSDPSTIKAELIQEFQKWTNSPQLTKEDDLSFVILRYKG